jgi:lysophospholipase L1-like esterase
MSKQLKWYSFRWRIILFIFLTIALGFGYIGYRLYNAVRTRPMGTGPTGPAIAAEPFTKIWAEQKTTFIGIGDSITRGLGAGREHTYFELLIKNDNKMYPDMAGRDLSSVFPNLNFHNYAQDYTITQNHVERQLVRLSQYDPNTQGIIVITSGGNDLIHDYGRTPPKDGAMYGCTYKQAEVWCENMKQRLEILLTGLTAKFPGGCEIFLANIYDPTDGYGDPQTMGLPRWPDCMKVIALANQKIAELCEQYPNVHLVDIHTPFIGHGIHCDEWWRATYRKEDPHYWYYTNLEDPNRRGFDAIRRLFLQEMIKVYTQHSNL